MIRRLFSWLLPVVVCSLVAVAAPAAEKKAEKREITDPEEAKADPDFAIQGEYLGEFQRDDGTKEKV